MLYNTRNARFNLVFIILVCFLIIEFLLLKNTPFFWDGISKSYRANWIYENGLTSFIVPTAYNAGHPPLWISLLAVFWTVFSKSLWASRLLLLFINIGVVWQIVLLCKENFLKSVSAFAVFIVCLEPTLVAQSTSLNNDMLLLFFTLLGLNSLIKGWSFWFAIALTGMMFSNLRGVYGFVALLIIHWAYFKCNLIAVKKGMGVSYVFALLVFAVFCYLQYDKLGWFLISENENYNKHRQGVGFKQIVINIIVYAKCFLEYGRFIIMVFLIPLLIKYIKNRSNQSEEINRILIACVVFATILFIGMVPFSNPFGDRYFLICYILLIVLLLNLLAVFKKANKKWVYVSLVCMFVSGHFWIYPATISQSWDSSLAYLNYYKIEELMEDYIDTSGIERTDIGTRVRLNQREYSELSTMNSNKRYSEFDIDTNKYILLSNIENSTKDYELNKVRTEWILVKKYSRLGVFVSLYKRQQDE